MYDFPHSRKESITNQENLNMCDNMNILSKYHHYTAK